MEEHLEYESTEGRTELSSLGKYTLIDRLTDAFEPRQESTRMGVGDDCAVIANGDKLKVVSTQLLVEGVRFDMTYTPLKHLGYKAIAVALSNICAMNALPTQVVVALAVSNRYSLEALEELYAGIRLCCDRYDVDLVGGDITSSVAGLTISVTAIGEVEPDRITYRKGAKLHDLVCVSGDLGSAYSGLLILEREKVTYQANPNFHPDFDGYDYVLERYLKPEPRVDIVHFLRERGVVPTSMTDVSAGLASDVMQLCKASHCGCEVYEERVPIDYQTTRVCSELNKNLLPMSNALNGGEDYELLFTISQQDYEKLKDCREVTIIGHITDEHSPIVMVTPQDTTITLDAPGWKGAAQ